MLIKMVVINSRGKVFLEGNALSVNIVMDYRFKPKDNCLMETSWISESIWNEHIKIVGEFEYDPHTMIKVEYGNGLSYCYHPITAPNPYELNSCWVDVLISNDSSYMEFPKNSLKSFARNGLAKIGGYYKNLRVNNEVEPLSARYDTARKQIIKCIEQYGGASIVSNFDNNLLIDYVWHDPERYSCNQFLSELGKSVVGVTYRVYKNSKGSRRSYSSEILGRFRMDQFFDEMYGGRAIQSLASSSRRSVFVYRGIPVSLRIPVFTCGAYKLDISGVLDDEREVLKRLVLFDDRQGGLDYIFHTLMAEIQMHNIISHGLLDEFSVKIASSSQSHLDTSAMCIREGRSNVKSVIESVFSIELSLKLYLYLVCEVSEGDLKHVFGHDIKKLITEAKRSGFDFISYPNVLKIKDVTTRRYDFVDVSVSDQWLYHEFAQKLFSKIVNVIYERLDMQGATSGMKCFAESISSFECASLDDFEKFNPDTGCIQHI